MSVRNKPQLERRSNMSKLHVGWVIFVAVMFLGASGSQTFSQTLQDVNIEQSFTNQTNAINDGVKSYQLTQGEAKILQDNLSRIRQEGVRLQGDGKLTAEETAQLNKMLDQNRQMIQDKKQFPVRPISSAAKAPAPAVAPVPPAPATTSAAPPTAKPAAPAPTAAPVPSAPATTPAAPPTAKPAAPVPPAQAPGSQTLQDTTIEQRLTNQTNAINQGVTSNQLNQGEARILQDNLSRIRQEGVRFQQDGKLTAEETTQLNKMLDQNGQMIQDKKQFPVRPISPAPRAPASAPQPPVAPQPPAKPVAPASVPQPPVAPPPPAKPVAPAPPAQAPSSQTLQDMTIEQKFTNQTNAINEGLKSKQLNQTQASILRNNLSHIRQEGARFQKDGKLTAEETTQINKMLDDNRQMIESRKAFPLKKHGFGGSDQTTN
jgi:uncharacterized protein HemX